MNDIPQPLQDALNESAKAYSNSPATTNAGRILRFIARILPPTTIIKLFAHKLS